MAIHGRCLPHLHLVGGPAETSLSPSEKSQTPSLLQVEQRPVQQAIMQLYTYMHAQNVEGLIKGLIAQGRPSTLEIHERRPLVTIT